MDMIRCPKEGDVDEIRALDWTTKVKLTNVTDE